MSLGYTRGCVNFRDVGEFVNVIAQRELFPEGRLLRGGKIDFASSADQIGRPGSIVNLRAAFDPDFPGADAYHLPAANDLENYDTMQPAVRRWLSDVVSLFEDEQLRYPVLVHCASGKDRTGVVVATLLRIVGVPDEVIAEEYLLSDGNVQASLIQQALAGLGVGNQLVHYFHRVDLDRVRRNLLRTNVGEGAVQ